MTRYERVVRKFLSREGIEINGNHAWDIQIHNKDLFKRVAREGSLGFGEAYMDGWWDVENLYEFMQCIHRIPREKLVREGVDNIRLWVPMLISRLGNPQSIKRSFRVGRDHYDIGNDLYKAMLGKWMTYSCGFWKNACSLDDAQEKKLDLVYRKLGLRRGMKVLDIGCGWGSFAFFAAERDVEVVGLTVSQEQKQWIDEQKGDMPIMVECKDYREILSKFQYLNNFDRVVSIGMFEHVGPVNYGDFFQLAQHALKPNGLMLLHTILGNKPSRRIDPWLEKYIFPGAVLPTSSQVDLASEKTEWIKEDEHRFGPYYALTLLAWWKNFDAWYQASGYYDERFYRMWKFYLLSCAALFEERKAQLGQFIFSKSKNKGDPPNFYHPIVH